MVFSKYRKEVYPLFPRRTRRGGQKFQNNHIEPYRHVEFQQYYNMDDEFSNDITIESTYKAPHHDEPEDLTDDLAPNMARQSAQQPTNLQLSTGAGASENKLNFKFQKTVPKNPDWTEYQNKFRSIGGGSPDNESADAQTEVKQEPNKDQPANTGLVNVKPTNDTASTSSKNQQPVKGTPVQKVVIQKVEIIREKSSNVNPIRRRYEYPKGIPKSFLVQRNEESYHASIGPQPNSVYGLPSGIPKSFLMQENPPIPMLDHVQVPVNPEPNPEPDYLSQAATHVDLPSWILPGHIPQNVIRQGIYDFPSVGTKEPLFTQSEPTPDRAYSPSDVYSEATGRVEEESRDGSESPDLLQSGQKRLSAFKRLGPLTQPKKPKLTINLMLNKENAVREVVDETDDSYRFVPVHLRKDIIESKDEIVVKYLPNWPWKRNLVLRKTVSARHSKSVMILQQEQMEPYYDKDNLFLHISVQGYPKTWTKEDVLDTVLESVKGKSFIPCFIEFTDRECKFLVIRCRSALLAIHKMGFCMRKGDIELVSSISGTDTTLSQIDLIPRLVLRKRLVSRYDGEKTLDLKEFMDGKDVSHFVYFPLNRVTNQMELIQIQSAVGWEYLTDLNLSHNRLTCIDGFELRATTPRLKHLDLSYNMLDKMTILLSLRDLPLRSLKLEGNPLCHDYIDSAHYIKVVKMMFSEVMELDGVRIPLKGDLLPMKRNYGPEAAVPLVEKFLETFFPLLEAAYDDRAAIEQMYDKDAVMTITFRYKLRYGSAYRYFRNLFLRSRCFEEGEVESVKGSGAITSVINKWPAIQHDRYSITVDVMHHDDSTTILRIGGILKLTSDSLAEDEHLLTFTRTLVLHTRNGGEYKIHNEMLYWDVPCEEFMQNAFNVTTVRPRQLSIKMEAPPDDELKSHLVNIFVKLADIDEKRGTRCLELKNWDLRSALEYYVQLLKLDDLTALSTPKESTTPVPQAS